MFATLHAGIGVKQTHSYARSLQKKKALFQLHSLKAVGSPIGMQRKTRQLWRIFAYMPFLFEKFLSFLQNVV